MDKPKQWGRYIESVLFTEDIFAKLAGCKFLSKMDFSKGFYKISLSSSSKKNSLFMSQLVFSSIELCLFVI